MCVNQIRLVLCVFVCLVFTSVGVSLGYAEDLFVLSNHNAKVLLFDSADSGLKVPQRDIFGASCDLTPENSFGIFLHENELYVSNEDIDAINVYSSTDNGDILPKRQIVGGATTFAIPRGLFISGSELFVADAGTTSIKVFNTSDNGNVAPIREIVGINTSFDSPYMCVVYNSEIYVVNQGDNLISVFNISDTGNVAPKRSFSVSGGMTDARGLWVDGGVVYVGACDSDRIMTFPSSSSGVTIPSSTIVGAATTLNDPYGLVVKGGYIYASNFATDIITVYKTTDNGNVAPQRTISSASLDGPVQVAMAIGGFVRRSEHQQSGVNVTITSTIGNATTTSEIQKAYNVSDGFDLCGPMGIFEATVDSNGANGVFRFNSTSLSGPVSDVRLIKCFEATGTSIYFGSYATVADPETEGTWWLEDANDNYISSGTTLTLGTNYYVNCVVKDNGKYDVNPVLGVIEDPAALGVYSSDSSSGCVMNPSAGLGLEWLFLALAVGLGCIRRHMH
ncbi:MAG: hypothetical protein BA863_15695 [Desulfovibrio sp. S3730MH75]|nr:MAG: hypothetical protein BA863_15695 [Desulfovibrio sp. S3730MH75]